MLPNCYFPKGSDVSLALIPILTLFSHSDSVISVDVTKVLKLTSYLTFNDFTVKP